MRRSKNIAGILLEEKKRRVRDTSTRVTLYLKLLFIVLNHVYPHQFSVSTEMGKVFPPAEVHPMMKPSVQDVCK